MMKKSGALFIIFFLMAGSFNFALLALETIPSDLNFRSAANYSEAMGGSSMLVMIGDIIIFEEYHNSHLANESIHIHSATKGFWSIVVASLIEDGYISGYDEKLWKSIDEWNNPCYFLKHRITIRHMVELTSGLKQDVDAIQGHDNYTAQDLYDYTINNLSFSSFPGRDFQYGPSHYYLLGAFMQAKGFNPLEYLEERIFESIGLVYDKWTFDPSGNPHIPNGAYLTAREWVKYGKLLRDKGNWNGDQIVDEQLVEQLLIPSENNPGHGKFLWLNTKNGFGYPELFSKAPEGSEAGFIYYDGYEDLFAAMGAGKNRLYMIPSLDMVIVRQSNNKKDRFIDHEFLDRLLNDSNHPPLNPTIIANATATPNDHVAITCVTTDSDGDQIRYLVDWDDGTKSEWTQLFDSYEKVQFTHQWESRGRYTIKVKAKDEHGAESDWGINRIRLHKEINDISFQSFLQIIMEQLLIK